MGLRDIGASLPPGFRFYPSDEELVCHYLYKKIANEDVLKGTLVEIDLHTCEPWQLPELAKLNSSEWYFFSYRDRKYATGYRTNRATISGYWKATGKDRTVIDPKTRAIVGMRKTLVFYKNRAPNGIKTGWIMHEFRLENPHIPPKEDWVLCRVFYKAKGDHSNEFSSQNTVEDGVIPPNFATSPPSTDQTMPCVYHHHHHHHHHHQVSGTFKSHHQKTTDFIQQNPNYLQLSLDGGGEAANEASIDEMIINSKPEDQYGFFFDMGFDHEHSFGDGAMTLEDMRFDEDDDIMA